MYLVRYIGYYPKIHVRYYPLLVTGLIYYSFIKSAKNLPLNSYSSFKDDYSSCIDIHSLYMANDNSTLPVPVVYCNTENCTHACVAIILKVVNTLMQCLYL